MVISKYLWIGIFALLFLMARCNLVVNPAGEVNNLIKNSSFEEDGKPSLTGWTVNEKIEVKLEKDTPKNGGHYSVSLPIESFAPVHKVLTYPIPEKPGKHVYLFSVFGKSSASRGEAMLLVQQADSTLREEGILRITDHDWTRYSMKDTIDLKKNEKLYVNLYGGGTELVAGWTNFDLVSLTKLGE